VVAAPHRDERPPAFWRLHREKCAPDDDRTEPKGGEDRETDCREDTVNKWMLWMSPF